MRSRVGTGNGDPVLGGLREALYRTICSPHVVLPQAAAGQGGGSIRGTVVDENGVAVSAAQVEADPLNGVPQSKALIIAESDKDGRFSIKNLELQSYKVFVSKESAGCPNVAFAFYSGHVFPTATLTATAPVVNLVLRIGPPAGIIHGVVKDAETGKPVSASFVLRHASDPNNWISAGQQAKYRVLIPPDTEVWFEVSAPGHRTFYYGGPSDPLGRSPLRLQSGQQLNFDIRLQLDGDTNSQ